MDFLDDKKKRAHRNRLFIGYGLMAIAITFATIILVFATNGYSVNPGTGKVTQFGLLFIDSQPDGAEIYLNGERKGTTSDRLVVEENEYDLEIRRAGYRTWQKNFVLEARAVERFAYPFLFPAELKPREVRLLASSTDMVSSSPDRRWIVSHSPAAFLSFDITDTSQEDPQTSVIGLTPAVLPVRAGTTLEAVEWSTDNKHLLVKAAYPGGADYILLNRESPELSLNLTQHFGVAFSQIRLRDKSADRLYVYDAATGSLQSADVATKAVSPLATGVVSYWPYGNDMVLYATTAGAPSGLVSVKLLDGADTYELRQVPISDMYLLNIARFKENWYFAIGARAEGGAYVYVNPVNELRRKPDSLPDPNVFLKVDGAQYLEFSANARFISVQGGSKFAVYDAELGRQSRYDVALPADESSRAHWMDGHRLTMLSQGKMYVFDFDGTNKYELLSAQPSFSAMFDRDYNNMFLVSQATENTELKALTRVPLRVIE